MMNTPAMEQVSGLTLRQTAQAWWPLAASWTLMTLEGPAMSAIVARLAAPEINLAAWGGVVSPFTFVIAAPIIMMLSAATALTQDYATFLKLRRFMMRLSLALTVLHAVIAFTPLYDVVARNIIGAPESIIEPGRIGMRIVTPWAWAIAFRRFNQGVMIRFGHSKAVGAGTMIRLGANLIMLFIGYLIGTIPGIIVACAAVSTGVVAEAIYAGVRVRPIVRDEIIPAPPGEPLTTRDFLAFYVPLALTSLIWVIIQPFGSAAISRMPDPLASLAAWPVVNGLLFLLRSPGMALNEVVVAQLGRPRAAHTLRRFTIILLAVTVAVTLLIVATPLANLWLTVVMALPENLVPISQGTLWLGIGLPVLAVLLSWFQGRIMHSRHTRSITEATTIYSLLMIAILVAGIAVPRFTGLYVAVAAFEIASLAQVGWLWRKSRVALREIKTN
ncbi:MAG TPA: hypothetical protein PKZ84_06995 [Anaerolineae bacterium]|nr:hypothetical protein [Anaerolineae bacterium]HQI84219.1 hypothetical protein [Anaerolineae bacterium]